MRPKIVGAGISGFIGTPLTKTLSGKYEVLRLQRQDRDGWAKAIDGAFAVINLSGENVAARRWTAAQKKRLVESRLVTTRALVDAMAKAQVKPKVFISASATGIYGDRGAETLTESSAPGQGFLSDLSRAWESEALRAESLGVRTVLLRTGIVLGNGGGAMAKMLLPFRLCVGGPLGHGRQIMSWIHMDDQVGAVIKAIEDDSIRGPVNLVAPNPVSMNDFAATLSRVLKRPAVFRVPETALKLIFGEMSSILTDSQNVRPEALMRAGYAFKYTRLEPALQSLV